VRRRTRRILLGAGAVPVALVAVLGIEVQLARMGPDLPDPTPFDHDGRIGGDGADPLRMVWLGDSTAAGVGASGPDTAMPRRVAEALERPVELTVRAISGARVDDVVDHQVRGLAALRPDVVLISIGANDVVHLTSVDSFRHGYRDLVAAIPEGALIVVLGVPDMGAVPRFAQPLRTIAGWRGSRLDGVAVDIARDAGALYVDIAGETGPVMRAEPGRRFASDRYHPSDDGYVLWASAVVDVLAPQLAGDVVEAPGGDR
jgi:lysophospholipase L1-like esterase